MYETYTHLYNTLVLPIIEYGSFLWGFKPIAQFSKVQNNLMRSFLGLGRNATIAALLGDMVYPMYIITQISCVRFFLRLNKMSPNRLNHIIFKESCHLADKGYKNWAFSIQELIQKDHQNHSQFMPTVDCRYSLVNFRDVLISLYTKEWIQEINEIRTESGSGGRLNLYRALKVTPQTERYVVNTRTVGGRRVMAGLRMGCLPLAVETGRYSHIPYQERVCRLCNRGEVEDQAHFIAICPRFNDIRLKLFNHCYSIIDNFYQLPLQDKIKFILCNYDNHMVNLLTSLYSCRQNIIYR